jgi:glycerol-3-phosphate acyltransferase PlsX
MARVIRVALDAMGGDRAPLAPVAGAVGAARAWGYEIQLVGREADVRAALRQQGDLTGSSTCCRSSTRPK